MSKSNEYKILVNLFRIIFLHLVLVAYIVNFVTKQNDEILKSSMIAGYVSTLLMLDRMETSYRKNSRPYFPVIEQMNRATNWGIVVLLLAALLAVITGTISSNYKNDVFGFLSIAIMWGVGLILAFICPTSIIAVIPFSGKRKL